MDDDDWRSEMLELLDRIERNTGTVRAIVSVVFVVWLFGLVVSISYWIFIAE